MATGVSRLSRVDGSDLLAALRHEPSASHVPALINRQLRAHVNGIVPRLRNQKDLEIVQQTWVHLTQVDPERIRNSSDVVGLAKWFLRSYAIREVLDGYTPPGCKKRARPDDREVPVSLEAPVSEGGPALAETLGATSGDDAFCERALARTILRGAAKTAPRRVARALWLIYVDGISFTAAAREVGVDHTTLRRELRRWAAAEGFVWDDRPTISS